MLLRQVRFLSAALTVFALAGVQMALHAEDGAGSVTVPMQVELNRPYIDVTLTGPNGQRVTAHAYVDTGGGAIIVTAGLAERLGLKATGKAEVNEGDDLAPTTVPALRIGGKALALVNAAALISIGEPHVLGHTDAEIDLPGRYLRHYIVVFDYPAHTFTLADPASYKPAGAPMQTTIGGGMPVVHAAVAGKPYAFLLDTGAQCSMVSIAELGPWARQHPDWPHVSGAYGPANMLLGAHYETRLTMLRIAALQWGPFRIDDAGAVSRPVGPYENMMSETVGTPVIGSIGGNVLRHFKVTVDYPAKTVYLAGPATVRAAPLDMVGITLEPTAHGGYEIAGIAAGVKNVRIGDRLLEIDGKTVTQMPFSRVIKWLSGPTGAPRTLALERGGARVIAHTTTRSIL